MTKQLRANLSAATLFLQEWLHCPQQIGAILPSSKKLAVAMANWLPPDPNEFVLELGPGTGSVTQAILDRGQRQDRLVAIEKSPKMASLLRERFPRAHVITGDACQMGKLLKKHVRQFDFATAVISSLPFRNFAPADAASVAWQIRELLVPHGRWIQFTYHIGN